MLFTKIFLILLAFLPADNDNHWVRVNTEQGISFLMPNRPQSYRKIINDIPSHIYQTKNLTSTFIVVCSDFSVKGIQIDNSNTQRLYEELKRGSLSSKTAYLKNERTIPYEDMIIKELEYSEFKDNYEISYFKRFIFRNNHIYQITISGRTRFWDSIEEDKEIFFNSISFPEAEAFQPPK